ncbi:uncharacterized protein METZ01_LOCUS422624, partial [marine metagenome]
KRQIITLSMKMREKNCGIWKSKSSPIVPRKNIFG